MPHDATVTKSPPEEFIEPPLIAVARREKPFWYSGTGLIVYAAIVFLIVTVLLSIWKYKQKQADRSYTDLVQTAEKASDPQETIQILKTYIDSHRDNRLTADAKKRLAKANDRLDQYQHDTAMQLADEAGEQYENAADLLKQYLETNPPQQYQESVEKRLARIPSLIDDRDYNSIDKRFPVETADLDGRRAALDDYLSKHPQGAHADAARKAAADIGDIKDDRELQRILTNVKSLRDSKRWNDAIAFIDSQKNRVVGTKRKAALESLKQELTTAREDEHYRSIQSMPVISSSDCQRTIAECRFFLLVRPQSTRAGEIKQLHDRLNSKQQAVEWQAMQSELASNSSKPEECLRRIDDFQKKWPGEESRQQATSVQLPVHWTTFKSAYDKLPPCRDGILTRKNGSTLSGEVTKKTGLYQVRDSKTGKSTFVLDDDVQGVSSSPKAAAADDILKAINKIDPKNIDLMQLRSLTQLAEKNHLLEQAILLRMLLIAIDNNDAESRRILSSAGYIQFRGQWINATERSPEARVKAAIENHQKAICEAADRTAAGLALRLSYSVMGTEHEVPVECTVTPGQLEIVSAAVEQNALIATTKTAFIISLRPKHSATEDDDDKAKIKRLVDDISKKSMFHTECEITENLDAASKVGMGVVLKDGHWLIDKVEIGGPAYRSWIEVGDEIVEINSVRIDSSTTAEQMSSQLDQKTNNSILLQLRRRGESFSIKLAPSEQVRSVLKTRFRIQHNIGTSGSSKSGEWSELPDIDDSP